MTTPNTESTATPKSKSSTSMFILIALALVVGLMMNERFSSVASAVDWGKDLPTAIATAKSESKPVLLNFSAPGCGYCVQMESEVIPQKDVLAAIEDYIPVKLDANTNQEAAARYDIYALPAYVIVDGNGTKLAMVDGFQPVDRFKLFLELGNTLKAAPSQ